jgi:hypothetical protein
MRWMALYKWNLWPEDAEPMDYQLHQSQQSAAITLATTSTTCIPAKRSKGFTMIKRTTKQHEPVIKAQVIGNNDQWAVEGQFNRAILSSNAQKSVDPPESWTRINHVFIENMVVAVYFLIYLFYLAWHFFIEMCPCNQGMMFAQRTADIFIMAAPCAFAFSVLTKMSFSFNA